MADAASSERLRAQLVQTMGLWMREFAESVVTVPSVIARLAQCLKIVAFAGYL